MDHVMQHLITAVKVSRAPFDPGALMDLLDVIPGWIKHLNPNELIESAERLMQQSVATKSQALIAAAKTARIKMADASTKLTVVEVAVAKRAFSRATSICGTERDASRGARSLHEMLSPSSWGPACTCDGTRARQS